MSDLYYPEINEHHIIQIAKLYESNPNYFTASECPYSKGIVEIFTGGAKYHDFDTHMPDIPDSDSIVSQVNQLSKELKEYGRSIMNDEQTSASDRNTYFRLSVALLEKLVDIREKITNIRDYENFAVEVLDIMDVVLDADQRAKVVQRLEGFITAPEKGTGGDKKVETKEQRNEELSEESHSPSGL